MAAIDPFSLVSGIFRTVGLGMGGSTPAAGGGATQFQSQTVSQAQANNQNVIIGSTLGIDPTGLSTPTGQTALEVTGLVDPGDGTLTSISVGEPSRINWPLVGAAGLGVLLLAWFARRPIRARYRLARRKLRRR